MELDRYAIDSDNSKFTVRAFASGMLSALGHNPTLAIRDFTGEAQFLRGTFECVSVAIRLKTNSITVVDKISDKDRSEIERTMNRDVLEIEKYPEVVFASSKVSTNRAGDGQFFINVLGELSLHGVAASQPIAAQVAAMGDTLRAHGEFTIVQTTYKIKLVSIAGGTLKLKDELKCSFDIVARKQATDSRETGRMLALEDS